ncbi:Hypothetical predicted protein [Podarcis lilfordi]|uniref:Uncharacterized protein n=1 Tax=Podarcis lilfordi TaxID=74358 RepID=A0AA35PMM0_9SAUR|nr:Hypothetical predicted protein [Podarcis lilfordi]CAI5793689.1 Hypothetical predicted protein [Podarcis lilfordi]
MRSARMLSGAAARSAPLAEEEEVQQPARYKHPLPPSLPQRQADGSGKNAEDAPAVRNRDPEPRPLAS